jgi:hypothetical protein
MNHEAIYKLYPQVVSITDDDGAFDKDGNKVEIDLSAVQAYANSQAYIPKRAAEYPAIGDQLDALWKGGDAAAEMLAKVQAVKAKYPKGA